MDVPSCRYPDESPKEENTMWSTLFKALLNSLAPQLKPVLDVLVKKALETLLKNLAGQTGVMPVMAEEDYQKLVDKTVEDLMAS
jgi:hypothetical protein